MTPDISSSKTAAENWAKIKEAVVGTITNT